MIRFGKEKGDRMVQHLVVELAGALRDLPEKLTLVTDSSEVKYIRELFGNPPELAQFDGFTIQVDDGKITAVWGFHGNVPYLHKQAYRIYYRTEEA